MGTHQTATTSTAVRGEQQREVVPAAASVGGSLSAPRVSVVIPALNEAKNVPYVFARFPTGISKSFWSRWFDGGTVEAAQRLHPNVRVVPQDAR